MSVFTFYPYKTDSSKCGHSCQKSVTVIIEKLDRFHSALHQRNDELLLVGSGIHGTLTFNLLLGFD